MEEKKGSGDARDTRIPRDGELNGGDLQSSDRALSATAASSLVPGSLLDLRIEIVDLPGSLFPTEGDTSFEKLECTGHNPNLDTLVGTIRVKKSAGYSGGPCQGGSTEYVTFWVDSNNNGDFETCIGTASVEVRDHKNLSKQGLEYTVFMPTNLGMLHHLYQHRDLRSPFLAMLLLLRLI